MRPPTYAVSIRGAAVPVAGELTACGRVSSLHVIYTMAFCGAVEENEGRGGGGGG